MKTRLAVASGVLALVTAAIIGLVGNRSTAPTSSANAHPVPASSGRLVVVSSSMRLSEPGQPLHVKLISGSRHFPEQGGVVLTDRQCQPDSAGVSHCLNAIRLADGQTITVRHMHRMMDVPCLTPGERVTVRASAA